MADPLSVSSNVAPAPTGTAASSVAPANQARIRDLAAQFEGLLMTQMMRDLKSAMVDDQDQKQDGFDTSPLGDTVTSDLGLALSRAGGFGLAQSLSGAIARQAGDSSADVTNLTNSASLPLALPALPAPGPGGSGGGLEPELALPAAPGMPAPAPSASLLPAGVTVSSGFGWRNDPIDGDVRFHKGVDIAVPQGQGVRSATAGRVAFVGQQTGYGLTVMVDNGQGTQTRYAHLSQATVQAGAQVNAGDVIAKSGNTGRSTGPHLHFEVLQNGQAVDPSSLMGSVVAGPTAAGQ